LPLLIAAMGVAVLAYVMFLIVRPFATSLVFAIVMAVVFYPLFRRLVTPLGRGVAAGVSTATVVLVIVAPTWLIVTRLIAETTDLAGHVRTLPFDTFVVQAQEHAARWGVDIETVLRNAAQQIAGQVGSLASRIAQDIWSLFVGIILSVLAMFFLFRDGEHLVRLLTRILPMPQTLSEALVREVGVMISSNLAASFVAASIQGTLGGLAFAWIGIPAPLLWGVVMGVFCVFPIVGAWLVWAPAAIALAAAHRTWDAFLLVIIGFAVVHPVDNLLRPAIVSHATKLNGFLVLIGLLGGVQVFGPSGLLLGPVCVAVVAALMETAAAQPR
jgi:predicted PurR-regulated permease PerM